MRKIIDETKESEGKTHQKAKEYDPVCDPKPAWAAEEASAYAKDGGCEEKQGEYTLEDYLALPDEHRAELIDGALYDMASPPLVHQRVVGEVFFQINRYIKERGGACIPVMSPIDVRLDCDEKTVVQPDVLILCDKGKMKKWGIMGAPDFILEVLSPGTRRMDCVKKLGKYQNAGVREYWMIDPEKAEICVYDFEKNGWPELKGLTGSMPVRIFEGGLRVDLDAVRELL